MQTQRKFWVTFGPRVHLGAFAAISLFAVALACTTQEAANPPSAPLETICKEPRPQMCPEIYQPVCGVTADGGKLTYPNSCQACAHASVLRWTPGECAKG